MILHQESSIQIRAHSQCAPLSHANHCQFLYAVAQRNYTQDNKRLQTRQMCFISLNHSHTFVDTFFF